ncbi:HNH endonuclease signature motif containing protein [Pseudomonas citronellolis]|uniref:HNH endonuclease signature motif containing protein n=1 Tax=Pseudomonas citronellolis TaxID=53408 RepID=UPI002D789BFA|nr:HNH endonuclease signature motif containing protein [Pseudomonas citronellolis]WRT83468.1 HNH endonuclease signature motif containing protein [Pseudomonas citronellolis]
MLTADLLRDIIHYDPVSGLFTWKRTLSNRAKEGHLAGTVTDRGYLVITIARRRMQAHRLAWLYVHGEEPAGVIDHLDGDALNNRIVNLRVVPQATNTKNNKVSMNNTSGHPGVYLNKRTGRWYAQIWDSMKCIHLGNFTDKADAVAARKLAEGQLGYVVRG